MTCDTHVTHAIEAGVPIEIVMAQVGHLSAEMTRHYTHLNDAVKRGAALAVEKKASPIMDVLRKQTRLEIENYTAAGPQQSSSEPPGSAADFKGPKESAGGNNNEANKYEG